MGFTQRIAPAKPTPPQNSSVFLSIFLGLNPSIVGKLSCEYSQCLSNQNSTGPYT